MRAPERAAERSGQAHREQRYDDRRHVEHRDGRSVKSQLGRSLVERRGHDGQPVIAPHDGVWLLVVREPGRKSAGGSSSRRSIEARRLDHAGRELERGPSERARGRLASDRVCAAYVRARDERGADGDQSNRRGHGGPEALLNAAPSTAFALGRLDHLAHHLGRGKLHGSEEQRSNHDVQEQRHRGRDDGAEKRKARPGR